MAIAWTANDGAPSLAEMYERPRKQQRKPRRSKNQLYNLIYHELSTWNGSDSLQTICERCEMANCRSLVVLITNPRNSRFVEYQNFPPLLDYLAEHPKRETINQAQCESEPAEPESEITFSPMLVVPESLAIDPETNLIDPYARRFYLDRQTLDKLIPLLRELFMNDRIIRAQNRNNRPQAGHYHYKNHYKKSYKTVNQVYRKGAY